MDRDALNNIISIKKPIEYASKNSFANIHKIKDLNSFIPSMVDMVIPFTKDDIRRRLLEIKKDFLSFDSMSLREKKSLLTESSAKLDIILKTYDSGDSPEKPYDPATVNPANGSDGNQTDIPLGSIKGVGPKTESLFNKMGIYNALDLLYFFPFRYEDRRKIKKISEAEPGKRCQVVGRVVLSGETSLYKRRKKMFEAVVDDGSATLTLKWFNYNSRYIKNLLRKDINLLASGEIKLFGGGKEMIHPYIEIIENRAAENLKKIVPFYHLTEGLFQKTAQKIISRTVRQYSSFLVDGVPEHIKRKRGLISLKDAVFKVHLPPNDSSFSDLLKSGTAAHKRLVYDEFFFLQIAVAMRRHGTVNDKGVIIKCCNNLKSTMIKALPFSLTDAQTRVISEIENDLASNAPMQRLLQGDVGCGKTVVAAIAAFQIVENGCQAAVMAPTEILAEQHFINFSRFADPLGVRMEILKGGMKNSEKKAAIDRIKKGAADIVIGTHAIIQEGVWFKKLGLAIIDEQHRFGVIQKARLKSMGPYNGEITPNMLVMTATPIPRALSMTAYGDLNLSIINELPPGRQKVETKIYRESDRPEVYEIIKRELGQGRQAYVVYPLVEESEKIELMNATDMFRNFRETFREFNVGLIHGKMKIPEKTAAMEAFKKGAIDLLVSTTVIEVGIDVPNASVMLIEHAERFGLSQLHQLRGRVGRGRNRALCMLLAQRKTSKESIERLDVMEKSSNGFEISEADLRIRGPGDLFGTRQSGMPDFRIADLLRDEALLRCAREDAFDIINSDPELRKKENEVIRDALNQRIKNRNGYTGTA